MKAKPHLADSLNDFDKTPTAVMLLYARKITNLEA